MEGPQNLCVLGEVEFTSFTGPINSIYNQKSFINDKEIQMTHKESQNLQSLNNNL